MDFLDDKIDEYVGLHTTKESEVLYELNRQTHLKVLQPRMLSGHLQGRVLSMLSHMISPTNILEIGTYTGYSAICLAEGLKENGKLYTMDVNHELESMTRSYIAKAGMERKIDFRIGNALDIIPTIDKEFDLVFIDADKHNYINYYHLVFDKVKSGGYIIADNVLWSGKVLEPDEKLDEDTRVLKKYNQLIHDDERVENVLFPIRDGLMIARKK
jgi:predicted O-methyltransferase YrrM